MIQQLNKSQCCQTKLPAWPGSVARKRQHKVHTPQALSRGSPQGFGVLGGPDALVAPRRHQLQQHVLVDRKHVVAHAKNTFRFEKRRNAYEVELGETKVTIGQDQLWMLALPVGGVLLAATVVGPLLIGLVFSAVAIGAAVSAGAIAFTTLFLPMILFFGFFTMMFGGLGMALFFPKMLSLSFTWLLAPVVLPLLRTFVGVYMYGIAAAMFYPVFMTGIAAIGLGVGWGVVAMLGGKGRKDKGGSTSSAASTSSASATIDVEPTRGPAKAAEPAIDPEVLEQSKQLREFDDLLAEREEARRLERWRQQKLGQK